VRIVYAALRDDYGDPARGPSFEEQNFYPALVELGHEVVPFDFVAELLRLGYEEMNRSLLRLVRELEPDLLFCVLFEEQLDRRVIREISEHTGTTTFNWFCDDHWRFDGYSRYWAPFFDWFSTTDERSHERYLALGFESALLTQWACNPATYAPTGEGKAFDVTFVGQPHGDRRRHVEGLGRACLDVQTWGAGWDNGRLSLPDMVSVFSRSRVNLNFSRSSSGPSRWRKPPLQIKARPFEIAACGGFVLAQHVPGLDRFLAPGREIDTFRSGRELISKARFYLEHEELREDIARRGCERTRSEHTYARRFAELFGAMGLAQQPERLAAGGWR
jgi:spore maturation protein CgeB